MKRKTQSQKVFTNFLLCSLIMIMLLSGCQFLSQIPVLKELKPEATLDIIPNEKSEITTLPKDELGVGSIKIREKDGMEMVYVPEGRFTMGSNNNDPDAWEEGKPEWEVYLDAYWIDKYEVTNAQYSKCVAEGACTMPSVPYYKRDEYYGNPEYSNYPVTWVNELQADAYCAWAGGRLPTEAEWEKAARGPNGNKYPWGDESPNCELSNFNQGTYENPRYCVGHPSEVGSYPRGASVYGALDMAGNVWEWVSDLWSDQYDTSVTRNPKGPETDAHRVFRGGSWLDDERSISTFVRYFGFPILPKFRLDGIGFRCAYPSEKADNANDLIVSQEAPMDNEQKPTAMPIVVLGVGSTMERRIDGMEMVYVPKGKFTMGSNDLDDEEKPVRVVDLNAYWIDKYEVSNAQYAMCVAVGECTIPNSSRSSTHPDYYGIDEFNNYPVIHVSWHQASAYCAWVGGRLPTEAEWEKAARGPNGSKYPWGNERPHCGLANYNQGSYENPDYCVGDGDTSPVGSYPDGASGYGALDMAGNVWEWVYDWYGPYDENDLDNPTGSTAEELSHVLRGGSWRSNYRGIHSAIRYKDNPDVTSSQFGFRCVLPQK